MDRLVLDEAKRSRVRLRVVVASAVILGVISFVSNLTSIGQLSGQADVLVAARFSFSRIVNAGVVWAALSVASGYAARTAWSAVWWGTVTPLLALLVHYGAGEVTGALG